MEKTSLTRTLARFIKGLSYKDLPPEAVERAKTRILDALGASFSGYDLPWCQMAIKQAVGSKGGATIFGSGAKAAAADAAFANAVLSHSVLLEDWAGGAGHPSITVVPVALAVAEEAGLKGTDVITAIVAGYEVIIRVAAGLKGETHPAFRRVPMMAPFGAAVAGKLLKLNEDQLTYALGHAANFASGLSEGWEEGTMEMMLHSGIGARTGVMLATLARMGTTAAEASLEGKNGFYMAFCGHTGDEKAATADLGKRFSIMDILAKRYPACGSHQAGTDMCLALKEQYHIEAGEIEKVQETVMPRFLFNARYYSFPGPFANPFQAQMSGKFCLAAALMGKPVTSPPFFARHYGDPEILAMARKVEMLPEKGRKTFHPKVEVFMKNGQRYVMDEDRSARFVPTPEMIQDKFMALSSDFLGKAKAARVVEVVMGLDKLDDIARLTGMLVK